MIHIFIAIAVSLRCWDKQTVYFPIDIIREYFWSDVNKVPSTRSLSAEADIRLRMASRWPVTTLGHYRTHRRESDWLGLMEVVKYKNINMLYILYSLNPGTPIILRAYIWPLQSDSEFRLFASMEPTLYIIKSTNLIKICPVIKIFIKFYKY